MRIVQRAAPWLGVLLVTLLLLEGGVRLAARLRWIETALPPGTDYWWSAHPELGMWRHPNARWEHTTACFQVVYETNSVGGRDVERPLRADGPRVVVLGDSFMEGWGVPLEARLSSRLEAATGIPHLNFAMSHFSPYQSLLAYRALAKRFDHDAVLVGLLPANDFLDAELDLAATIATSYLYRPYLVGEPPAYQRFDHRESAPRFWLRRHSFAANALLALQSRWAAYRLEATRGPVLKGPDGQYPSWFYDFGEPQLARLAAVLRMLADEAGGRPVAVLLLPVAYDVSRFAASGPPPLAERLRAALAGTPVRIVDLLPELASTGTPPEELYFSCDYHWSRTAHAIAARIVQRRLTGVVY